MQSFKLRDPDLWEEVENATTIEYDNAYPRNVRQTVNSTDKVAVYYADNPEMNGAVLVGASDGVFQIEVAMRKTGYLTYVADPGTKVFVKSHVGDQRRNAVDAQSFTTLEPQGRRNSDLDRMMQYVKLNEAARQRQMTAEIAKMRAEMKADTQVVDPEADDLQVAETETKAKEAEVNEAPETGAATPTA